MLTQPGKYRGTAVEAIVGKAESSGNYQIGVLMHLPDVDDYIVWRGTFASDAANEFTFKALRAMGWTGDDLSVFDGSEVPEEMKREVTVVVEWKTNTRTGLQELEAKYINAGGGIPMKQVVQGDELKRFGNLMKAAARAVGGAPRPAPPAAAKQAPAPAAPSTLDKDDIPF